MPFGARKGVLMKRSHKAGLGFGITSGIITTMGLMVGLYAGKSSEFVILSGVLTIAIADAFADAAGIHVSKKAVSEYSIREVWEATVSTFLTKFCVALSFVWPLLFFAAKTAVLINVVWGILLLSGFSVYIAKDRQVNPWRLIFEHLTIAAIVLLATYHLPLLLSKILG